MGGIGELIRRRREELGYSQAQAAKRIGIKQGTLSLIEAGVSQPTIFTIAKVLRALSLSPLELAQALEEEYERLTRGLKPKRKRNKKSNTGA